MLLKLLLWWRQKVLVNVKKLGNDQIISCSNKCHLWARVRWTKYQVVSTLSMSITEMFDKIPLFWHVFFYKRKGSDPGKIYIKFNLNGSPIVLSIWWLFCLDIPVPYLTHIDLVDAGLEVGNNISTWKIAGKHHACFFWCLKYIEVS